MLAFLGVIIALALAIFKAPAIKETFDQVTGKKPNKKVANIKANLGADPKDNYSADTLLIDLKAPLEALSQGDGLWAIYVKDLKSGAHISINNQQMVAASLIKLFIMAGVYQTIENGELVESELVNDLLRQMITISHNEASNKLVEMLGQGSHERGMTVVNRYARSIACLDTKQERDMKDYRTVPVAGENYTSVEDCAKLLEKIYHHQCISPQADEKMMNLLLAQERKLKIPLLLPQDIKIAHKTGELSTTENDVGIVFAANTDYILCVMSNGLTNTAQAREKIAQISKLVYDFMQSSPKPPCP